jgi:hypothetical protein
MEKVENLHIYTRQWFKAVGRSDIPSGSDRVDNLQIQTGLIYLKGTHARDFIVRYSQFFGIIQS